MADLVKEITEVWNQAGAQDAYDRGKILLETITEEIRGLQGPTRSPSPLSCNILRRPGHEARLNMELFDSVRAPDRPQVILDAAAAVLEATSGGFMVDVQDVLAELQRRDLNLGVQQPLAVIGTVLSRSDYYHKAARNSFRRVDPLPLP